MQDPKDIPEIVMTGECVVPVHVVRHNRARRLKLAADPVSRSIRLTLPPRCGKEEAVHFFHAQQEWLHHQLQRWQSPVPLQHGSRFPLLGEQVTLHYQDSARGHTRLQNDVLYLPGAAEHKAARLERFLRRQLRQFLQQEVQHFAEQINVTPRHIRLREARSRWGSCSAAGDLSFNWRLAFAPEAVARYVAAHETAHCRHMNHSPAFWGLVAELQPDYQHHRNWLKQEGSGLFAYRLL